MPDVTVAQMQGCYIQKWVNYTLFCIYQFILWFWCKVDNIWMFLHHLTDTCTFFCRYSTKLKLKHLQKVANWPLLVQQCRMSYRRVLTHLLLRIPWKLLQHPAFIKFCLMFLTSKNKFILLTATFLCDASLCKVGSRRLTEWERYSDLSCGFKHPPFF